MAQVDRRGVLAPRGGTVGGGLPGALVHVQFSRPGHLSCSSCVALPRRCCHARNPGAVQGR
ncbi:hypothetical protein KCH_48510 [Kitasatospora cheerisanensis KCTC 2395]|uniref:Uncharacterized protein n=1 Tax=Kitasatospora cheerisanensis KCTC 2395 TaxID=1348663 RepID=A0A066YTQ9_9ACTN|nr:hypothetical protein KCH_48510 [Kitasatospora cheerisanensis KCTC 2395]